MDGNKRLTAALRAGLRWLTEVEQPPGAIVAPSGCWVEVAGLVLGFGPGDDDGALLRVSRPGGADTDRHDRARLERLVAQAGFGVVGVSGFVPSPALDHVTGLLVLSCRAHPSLRAAVAAWDARTRGARRPQAVTADFTAALVMEAYALRDELDALRRAARAAGG